jgi:hypothetical protein
MPWKPTPIPTVYPVIALKVYESGRTLPLEMRCESGHSSENYIVKLWNNVELKTHSLAREIYGSLLADYFGLSTPPIALVDISQDFAESIPNSQTSAFVKNSPGLNFGSQYLPGSVQFNPPVSATMVPLAARIFCFDMLIGNMDRRMPKINMFKTPDGFILYDHEQAFPHSLSYMFLGSPPLAWDFIREAWSKDHILYQSLKGRSLSFEVEEFISDLVRLKDNILIKIEEQIPAEWEKNVNNITTHLAKTRDNADLFKRSLQELLA